MRLRPRVIFGCAALALACVLACLLAGSLLAPGTLRASGKQPKKTNGQYAVTVAGYYTGTGTADIKNKKIMIKATVRVDDSGPPVDLVAPDLELDGDHFAGAANAQGAKLQLKGRLDGYAGDKDFRGARLLCTYTDEAGHAGRIAGVLH